MNTDDCAAVTIDDRYTWYIHENLIIDQEHGGPVNLAALPGNTSSAAKSALRLIYENIILKNNFEQSNGGSRCPGYSARASPSTLEVNVPNPNARPDVADPQLPSPKRICLGVSDTILGLHADTSGFNSNNSHQIILSDGTVHKSLNAAKKGSLLRFRKTGNLLFAIPPEPSLAEFYQWKSELLTNITTPDRPPVGDYNDVCKRLDDLLKNDGKPAILCEHIICNFTLTGMSSNNLSLCVVCADGTCRELRMFGSAHALFYKCFQRVDFDPSNTDQYKIELEGMFTLKRNYHPQFKMGTIRFLDTPQWQLLMSRKSKFG